ncbi:hypothetical protein ACMA5I_10410 [Paracoccaceae bacterium GXU_MW_L88]
MKVDITHSEVKEGLVMRKTYPVVTVAVQFTEKEKAIIKKENISRDFITQSVPINARKDRDERIYYMTAHDLMKKPYSFRARDSVEAHAFEDEAIEGLQLLARYFEASEVERENKSFEL